MNKVVEQIKEKIIIALILSMLGIGGTFLWNTGKDLWNLPGTVRHLNLLHTKDSTMAVKYIYKLDSISKAVGEMRDFQDFDYKEIKKIKHKLNIK